MARPGPFSFSRLASGVAVSRAGAGPQHRRHGILLLGVEALGDPDDLRDGSRLGRVPKDRRPDALGAPHILVERDDAEHGHVEVPADVLDVGPPRALLTTSETRACGRMASRIFLILRAVSSNCIVLPVLHRTVEQVGEPAAATDVATVTRRSVRGDA